MHSHVNKPILGHLVISILPVYLMHHLVSALLLALDELLFHVAARDEFLDGVLQAIDHVSRVFKVALVGHF